MRQSFEGTAPSVHPTAFVHPSATLIGDVTLAARASVWPGAVLRGDHGAITLGQETNVQDNAVLHDAVELGPRVTVGHAAVVQESRVEEGALVGINAVVLDRSTVGAGAVVAAGSVVTEDSEVPPGALVAGTPATVVREEAGDLFWDQAATEYVELAQRHREAAELLEE